MTVLNFKDINVLKTYTVMAHCKIDGAMEYVRMPVIFPHTVMSTLADHYKDELHRSVGAPRILQRSGEAQRQMTHRYISIPRQPCQGIRFDRVHCRYIVTRS